MHTIAKGLGLIGRDRELEGLHACVLAGRHVLLEGPVGVGKTELAKVAAAVLDRGLVRIDGDGRYSEARLVGSFDPPQVLERGYAPDAFLAGPLVRAMREGAVLLVNELNRMPEGVQNVLLPSMDEGLVHVPHLGTVHAEPGFTVLATQNPSEFVATGELSEALLDRFELIRLEHQDRDEELAIVRSRVRRSPDEALMQAAVDLVRSTRKDVRIRRGASVRAAVAIADLAVDLGIGRAAELALPTRIELFDERATEVGKLVESLGKAAGVTTAS